MYNEKQVGISTIHVAIGLASFDPSSNNVGTILVGWSDCLHLYSEQYCQNLQPRGLALIFSIP